MITNPIQSELYTSKTMFTLGGSSTAVWLFTGVLATVFGIDPNHYKWIGLTVALVLSYVGAFSIKKIGVQALTVAFFNGLLIYITATGINSINQGVKNGVSSKESALLSFGFDKAWWPTASLEDSVITLKKKLDSSVRANKELKMITLRVRDSLKRRENNFEKQQSSGATASAELNSCLARNKKAQNELSRANAKLDSLRKSIPVITQTLSRRDLEYLKELNGALLKNLNGYLKEGATPKEQATEYRTLDERVLDLQGDLIVYNKKIDALIKKAR